MSCSVTCYLLQWAFKTEHYSFCSFFLIFFPEVICVCLMVICKFSLTFISLWTLKIHLFHRRSRINFNLYLLKFTFELGNKALFSLLWQSTWPKQLKEGGAYFDSQFQGLVHHTGEVTVVELWDSWSRRYICSQKTERGEWWCSAYVLLFIQSGTTAMG